MQQVELLGIVKHASLVCKKHNYEQKSFRTLGSIGFFHKKMFFLTKKISKIKMFFDSPIFFNGSAFLFFSTEALDRAQRWGFFLLFTLSAKQDLGQNFVLACSFFLLLLSLLRCRNKNDILFLVFFSRFILKTERGEFNLDTRGADFRDGICDSKFMFHTRCQFHQHFMSSFCAKILSPKN